MWKKFGGISYLRWVDGMIHVTKRMPLPYVTAADFTEINPVYPEFLSPALPCPWAPAGYVGKLILCISTSQ